MCAVSFRGRFERAATAGVFVFYVYADAPVKGPIRVVNVDVADAAFDDAGFFCGAACVVPGVGDAEFYWGVA